MLMKNLLINGFLNEVLHDTKNRTNNNNKTAVSPADNLNKFLWLKSPLN